MCICCCQAGLDQVVQLFPVLFFFFFPCPPLKDSMSTTQPTPHLQRRRSSRAAPGEKFDGEMPQGYSESNSYTHVTLKTISFVVKPRLSKNINAFPFIQVHSWSARILSCLHITKHGQLSASSAAKAESLWVYLQLSPA